MFVYGPRALSRPWTSKPLPSTPPLEFTDFSRTLPVLTYPLKIGGSSLMGSSSWFVSLMHHIVSGPDWSWRSRSRNIIGLRTYSQLKGLPQITYSDWSEYTEVDVWVRRGMRLWIFYKSPKIYFLYILYIISCTIMKPCTVKSFTSTAGTLPTSSFAPYQCFPLQTPPPLVPPRCHSHLPAQPAPEHCSTPTSLVLAIFAPAVVLVRGLPVAMLRPYLMRKIYGFQRQLRVWSGGICVSRMAEVVGIRITSSRPKKKKKKIIIIRRRRS